MTPRATSSATPICLPVWSIKPDTRITATQTHRSIQPLQLSVQWPSRQQGNYSFWSIIDAIDIGKRTRLVFTIVSVSRIMTTAWNFCLLVCPLYHRAVTHNDYLRTLLLPDEHPITTRAFSDIVAVKMPTLSL